MSEISAVTERVVATVTAVSPRGTATAVLRETKAVVSAAARQGQAGPPGANAAAPTSYPINGVASLTARHGLPFAPEAWIVTADGESVEADVLHQAGMTVVIFPSPFTGTLYLR